MPDQKQQQPTMTAEQKKAARAQAEKQRRENIKIVTAQLEKAGVALGPDTKLTKEQKERALESATKKAGLTGHALAAFIMDGKNLAAQVEEAKAADKAAQTEEKAAKNVTRSSDPEATELAQKAKALAPDVKSAFLPKDAREAIDLFAVSANGTKVTVKRPKAQGTEGALEEVVFEREALEAFAIGGNKDKDVRGQLAGLGKGSRLWGRKLGLMLLARS